MGPVAGPVGTVTVRLVLVAAVTDAATQVLLGPVKRTVLAPGLGRKPIPEMPTVVPTFPLLGVKLLMLGTGARTVTTVRPEVKPVAEAVMLVVPSKTPVTLAGALMAPAGMATLPGTVAIPGAALSSITVSPPAGAGAGSWTVRPPLCPSTKLRKSGTRVICPPLACTEKVLRKGTRGLPLVSWMLSVSTTV
jgi:hypothetical protein